MIRSLLSSEPVWFGSGLAVIRILFGILLAYHGLEVFDRPTMETYLTWDVIKNLPGAEFMVYLGKGLELVTGICLALGMFTRISALFAAIDLLYICFFVGNGRFWYEDQHPFALALIALIFFFAGPVKWSVDHVLYRSALKDV